MPGSIPDRRIFYLCRIKLKRIRNITLILNFAENHLEQFKERRLLLHVVEKSFAIQAGREVRIMVKPEVIAYGTAVRYR